MKPEKQQRSSEETAPENLLYYRLFLGLFGVTPNFIKFNNTVLTNQPDRRDKIAYLPQHQFLPKNIRIKNLINFFCNEDEAEQLLNVSLIQPFLNHTVRKLSGGEQRIVEALLIVYSKSAFILLDEPFHSLSPKVVDELKRLIKEKSKQKGFIISDHNYQDVLDISDDIYLLSGTYLKPVKDFKELEMYNYLPKNFNLYI